MVPAPYGRLFAIGYLVVIAALWSGVIGDVATTGMSDATPPAWSVVATIGGGLGVWLLTWPLRRYRPAVQSSSSPYMVAWYRLALGVEMPTAIRALRHPPAHGRG